MYSVGEIFIEPLACNMKTSIQINMPNIYPDLHLHYLNYNRNCGHKIARLAQPRLKKLITHFIKHVTVPSIHNLMHRHPISLMG